MKTNKIITILLSTIIFFSCKQSPKVLYLDQMDLSKVLQGWNVVHINKNFLGDSLSINGVKYQRGIWTHAISEINIELDGKAHTFKSFIGIDDNVAKVKGGSVDFQVIGDGKYLYKSGEISSNQNAKEVVVDIKGIKKLTLLVDDCGNGTHHDHADWVNAYFEFKGDTPRVFYPPIEEKYILTPKPGAFPHINTPSVYGARPGNDFIYKVPATGEKPLEFDALGLPVGLKIDSKTGIITGKIAKEGEYNVSLKVSNKHGGCVKKFSIVCGKSIALTPPMGWNSWNCWGLSVDQDKVKKAADFLVSSGLADYGWSYINIDDGWEADARDKNGVLLTNEKFKDMKALADYIHAKGLKIGIYSSPGTLTCGKFVGSYNYEEIDAKTWANWGIDYLKHDWCSYSTIVPNDSLSEYQKPYQIMRKALDKVNRDIVYSLCQYGMKDVWTWGEEIGGDAWRTTGDIIDTWNSVLSIGFRQEHNAKWNGPSHWNDPDMLVVGKLGWSSNLHESRLSPSEQYAHISLWALLSAPMLLGCDLSQMDEFTLNLLTNNEVIAINQDFLGNQAIPVIKELDYQIYVKNLADSTKAIGVFNLSNYSRKIELDFEKINLSNKQDIRDVWRQKDLGTFTSIYSVDIPRHGVALLILKDSDKIVKSNTCKQNN